MVDMQLILYSAIGAAVLAAIALIGSHMSTIVSVVSRLRGRMAEEGRARHAYRQRVYNVAIVSDSQIGAAGDPCVMSRREDSPPLSMPSSLQTDGLQTDRQPTQAQPGRAELLTLYQTLRGAGMSREKMRPVLKAVGIPLDNNLWAEAASLEEAQTYVTPIVGRPTNAQFETDRDFPYVPPSH